MFAQKAALLGPGSLAAGHGPGGCVLHQPLGERRGNVAPRSGWGGRKPERSLPDADKGKRLRARAPGARALLGARAPGAGLLLLPGLWVSEAVTYTRRRGSSCSRLPAPWRVMQCSLLVPEGFLWPRVGLSPSLNSQISEAKAAQAFPAACRACPAQLQCSSGGTSRRLPPLAGLERCRLSANAVCGHLLPPPPTASWQRLQLPSEQPALCISPPLLAPARSSLLLFQAPSQDLEMVVSPLLARLQAASQSHEPGAEENRVPDGRERASR